MKDNAIVEELVHAIMNMLAGEEHLAELMEKNIGNNEICDKLFADLKTERGHRQELVAHLLKYSADGGTIGKAPNTALWCVIKHKMLTVIHLRELIQKSDVKMAKSLNYISKETMLSLFLLIKYANSKDFNECARCDEDANLIKQAHEITDQVAKKVTDDIKRFIDKIKK